MMASSAVEILNACCWVWGEWAQWVVSRAVIIPHLQVFLLLWSLSSLVKRKSICSNVYEREREREKGELGSKIAGSKRGKRKGPNKNIIAIKNGH